MTDQFFAALQGATNNMGVNLSITQLRNSPNLSVVNDLCLDSGSLANVAGDSSIAGLDFYNMSISEETTLAELVAFADSVVN